MFIKKIDDLFSITNYKKHYDYKTKKLSYITRINNSAIYSIYLTKHTIKTEIPLNKCNYFYSSYHNTLEDVYKYLSYILSN
jgi:hypothetical protein